MYRGKRKDGGGILVETVLFFPFFLLGIMVFIWLGLVMNAKSALTASVSRAPRIAITRADSKLLGGHMIQPIENWHDHTETQAERERVYKLLMYPPENPATNWFWTDAEHRYNTEAVKVFNPAGGLRGMPPEYIYTLVYLNEYMRQSVGGSVRYPCEPDAPDAAGCFSCTFLNPDDWGTVPGSYNKTPPTDRIGVECRYQPGHYLIEPIQGLLRFVSGNGSTARVIVKRNGQASAKGP